jgi:hypothetical protein
MVLAITQSLFQYGKQKVPSALFAPLIVLMAMISVAEQAKAQVIFDPAVTYTRSKFTDDTGTTGNSDTKTMLLDLKGAYLFTAQGIYVGALYKYADSTFTGGDLKGYELGPTVGWTSNGWSVSGTYFFLGERKTTIGGTETKFTEPKGLQVDLAYTHMFTPSFGFGPQLTYRNVTYDKSQVGGAGSTSAKLAEESLTPYFAFHFQF